MRSAGVKCILKADYSSPKGDLMRYCGQLGDRVTVDCGKYKDWVGKVEQAYDSLCPLVLVNLEFTHGADGAPLEYSIHTHLFAMLLKPAA